MDKPFELLAELGRFTAGRKISLHDRETVSAFLSHAKGQVRNALDDDKLLHGHRTEAMFEALVVSLGQFQLLNAEDSGRCFPEGRFAVPDFRIVLPDGTQWLVEVKNKYTRDPYRQHLRLKPSYVDKLAAYAKATGAELKVAVFWARWSVWTLVSPERFVGVDGGVHVDMRRALAVNELSALGDRLIATRPPLRLRLLMDPQRTSAIDAEGQATVTIGDTALFCGGEEITEPSEREIAWVFMQYGGWREESPEPIVEGDRLLAIDYRWNPVERTDQGFESVGTLSRMFARYYARHTIDADSVIQLQAPLRPDWFKPLHSAGGGSKALPLWKFEQRPNFDVL